MPTEAQKTGTFGTGSGSKHNKGGKIIFAAFVLIVAIFIAADLVRDYLPSNPQPSDEIQTDVPAQTSGVNEIFAKSNDPANTEYGKVKEGQARSIIDSEKVIILGALNANDIPTTVYAENGATIAFSKTIDNGDGTRTIYYTVTAPDAKYIDISGTGGIEMTFKENGGSSGFSKHWTSGIEHQAVVSKNVNQINFKVDYAIAT